MALTETALRAAKPREKSYRINDSNGLFAEVKPTGAISLRVRYSYRGRDSLITVGKWPFMTIREARDKCYELKRLIANGIDPAKVAKYEETAEARRVPTYGDVAAEWLAKKQAETTNKKNRWILESRLTRFILPHVGEMVPDEISAPVILSEILRPIEATGKLETARRVLQMVGQIFRYGIITGRATRDPSSDLRGALLTPPPNHYAYITDRAQFAVLLRQIDDYGGSIVVREALRLLSLTFVRPGELRSAEWAEFRGDEWIIPAAKMKMKREHVVPLSRQAAEVVEGLRQFTGAGRYLFPGARTASRPISDATIIRALRLMGYEPGEMSAHGFRHTASTILNESRKWTPDAIERQLAHADSDKIRAVYNYAEYLDERREMMQWWADFLDELRDS